MEDYIPFVLKVVVFLFAIMFFLSGGVYFGEKLEQMHLEEMRYCKSCGADLLKY